MVTEEIIRENEEMLFRDYVGQCLWEIDSIFRKRLGIDKEITQYIELAHPETKKEEMTAEEIKQHVLNGLR